MQRHQEVVQVRTLQLARQNDPFGGAPARERTRMPLIPFDRPRRQVLRASARQELQAKILDRRLARDALVPDWCHGGLLPFSSENGRRRPVRLPKRPPLTLVRLRRNRNLKT